VGLARTKSRWFFVNLAHATIHKINENRKVEYDFRVWQDLADVLGQTNLNVPIAHLSNHTVHSPAVDLQGMRFVGLN